MQRRQPQRQTNNRARRGSGKKILTLFRGLDWRIRLAIIAVCVILAVLVVYLLRCAFIIAPGASRYYDVTVNGVNLKGYTRSQAQDVFGQLLSDWGSRDYTLTADGKEWHFTAEDFDAQLEVSDLLNRAWNLGHYGSLGKRCRQIKELKEAPVSFLSELNYDKDKVARFVDAIGDEIDLEPIDAEVVMDMESPKIITESRDGRKLDREAAQEGIVNLMLTNQTVYELPVEVLEPAVSSDEASGGLAVLAYYATDMTTSNSNRYNNVKLALNSFNALAVYDGDTVSFNDVVGDRTKERGYKEAPEYAGSSVVTGYGGGSCQASTTLYCAVVKAGCDIIERHPHNMTVAYADPSLDATVSYGNKDFVFKNNTGHTIYIYTDVTRETALVVIYGNRTEYRIDFQSIIVKENLEASKEEIREDVTGKVAYFTDEKILYSQGKKGCVSQGWIVYYDWATDQEVKRVQVSQDQYSPGTSIYYKGVHERGEGDPPAPSIYD